MKKLFIKLILIFFISINGLFSFSQSVVTLVFPKNGYTIYNDSITLSWNKTNDALTYNILVSTDTYFTDTIIYTSTYFQYIELNNLIIDSIYYWKVRAFNGTTFSDWSNVRKFYYFTPIIIPTLTTWLKADGNINNGNDSLIEIWNDESGNFNNYSQADETYKPIFIDSVLNDKPVIRFNGDNDLQCDSSGKISTVFVVANSYSGSVYPTHNTLLVPTNYTTAGDIFLRAIPNSSNLISNGYFGTDLYINGIQTTETTPLDRFKIIFGTRNTPNTYNGYRIGRQVSNYTWNGDIAEIIFFDSLLSEINKENTYNYLRYKYAPPVNLGFDIHIPHGFCDTTIDAGSRFTNFSWSTGETTQTITINQAGQYSVTVTDIFGFQSTDTVMVYYPEPTHLTDTTICLGDTITWDSNMDTSYHFLWSTSDTTPQIQIWQQGLYYLQVVDTFGCKFYSDTIFVKVDSFPQTATLGPDTSLCAGVNITLESGNASATSYLWSTSDTTQYITINSPDNYSITVTDTMGCVAKDTVQITIHGQAPVPNFTWDNICFGDSTQLVDSSYTIDNSHIISWQWQLPDTSLTTQNVTFTFSDTGSFPVILVINTDSNCSNTIQKQVTIHTLPQADFSTTQLCNNVPINFSENITSIDSITTYLWDFSDTSTDTTANPTHEYTNSGNFPVSLTVSSLFGCKDSITKTLEIKPSPVIDFSHSVVCSGKQAQFNDLSITSPIFPIISWQWNFGDNTTSTTSNPIHIYSDTGTYIVSLAAQSLNGCTQNKTDTITVFPSQQTDFYADSLCANTTNQLTDSTIITGDSISTWSWYINNKLESNEQSPEFYFQDDGTYLISLITQTTHQCADSISKYLQVNPTPNSVFSFYPEIGTPIYYLSFSTDSNLNYLWNFGDNFTSTEQNPQHLYINSGSYQVTLITSNNYGCRDTTQKTVLVVLPIYDVAILDYTPKQIGNYLSFSCRFLNMGSLPLDSVNLTLQIQDAPYIMEKWTGHIMPGTIVTYEFALHYQISGKIPSATCVEAMVSGQTEDPTPENNLKCSNSTNDFIFYSLFPNPGENTIFVEFNNTQKQTINFQIIDKLGKIVFTDKLEQLSKGFQRIKININYLESGTYTFKIFSNIDSAEKQFMVH